MEAVYHGSLDCVRLLDEMEGVDWSAKSVEANISLISWASKSTGQAADVLPATWEAIFRIIELRNPEQALGEYTKYSEEGVRRILVGAVDVNQCNGANQSSLHLAMASGRPNIVTQLLARPETRLNTVDLEGRTPLHAVSTGAFAIQDRETYSSNLASSLRVFCQDPRCTLELLNKKDKKGCSPLMLAVSQNNAGNLLEFEKLEGIDWDTRNNEGQTLMDVAKSLRHGMYGKKLISTAELMERRELAERLDAGFNVNSQNGKGLSSDTLIGQDKTRQDKTTT